MEIYFKISFAFKINWIKYIHFLGKNASQFILYFRKFIPLSNAKLIYNSKFPTIKFNYFVIFEINLET